MNAVPVLSVIIVSWNVREHVLACIASVEADRTAPDLEILLVDNASDDDTVSAVLEQYPHVRVIALPQNVGFPRANNEALARARGRYVLFLNPDTEVQPGALHACVGELDRDAEVGVIGCRLDLADGTVQKECARRTYHFRHLVYESLYLHMLLPRSPIFADHVMGAWDHLGTRDVEAVSGAFLMTRTELARELGGLPAELFMYHEDLSYCLRVLRRGYRIRYRGDVSTVHHWARSSSKSAAPLCLLEAECRYRFVLEADGPGWAALARAVIGVRAFMRMGIATAAHALPARTRRKYPRAFDLRGHWLQLRWALSPSAMSRHMPQAPRRVAEPRLVGAWT